MSAPVCYKVVNADGTPCHGGTGRWSLPTDDAPGEWMPPITNPIPCERGYHLCEGTDDVVHWLGPVIYIAEWRGQRVRHEQKIVVSEARLLAPCAHWTPRTARLYAASGARDVLPLYEQVYPGDDRVRAAIEAAEAFAEGRIDQATLSDASADARAAAAAGAGYAAERHVQGLRLAHLLATGEIVQDVTTLRELR